MTGSRNRRARGRSRLAAVLVVVATTLVAAPAVAADGNIDHVESKNGKVQILYSLQGAGDTAPDLDSLEVTLDGVPLDATGTLASDAGAVVRRTAVLAIDVSESMEGAKFDAAKRAAQIFLDSAPADLFVGIVTFSGEVAVAQEPTLDRAASAAVIDGLELSIGTFLYDGIKQAVTTGGTDGQRSVIVLSDGVDTSDTKLETVTADIENADVKVDVVALAQSASDERLLKPLSDAGSGEMISAGDADALGAVFASEAETLARQVLVTATPPSDSDVTEGTLSVSIAAGAETYTDAAFVTVAKSNEQAVGPSTKLTPAKVGLTVSPTVMLVGLGAVGLGVLVILLGALGGIGGKKETLESRIDAYTQKGRRKSGPVAPPAQGVAAQAVGMATKALGSNRGFEVKLGDRLDAAGMSLKPAEWLLLHAGIAFGAAAVAFAVTSAGVLFTLIALFLGIVLPWVYLGIKRSRRLKAFNAQLAGCLQLLSGSLQAGLSLAQSIDTVVREGSEPLAGEFRRALVETRLGVPIEDALDSVGKRMESADFEWTVMAIRIQREVGGNLSELLLNVAATLREREYLRRQVKSLSAEGRFSAYILLALPLLVIAYMMLSNPDYVDPLISTSIGWVMLGAMFTLMTLGAVTMKKLVKVEV